MASMNNPSQFFYAEGSAIEKGDVILFENGRFPAIVDDFYRWITPTARQNRTQF